MADTESTVRIGVVSAVDKNAGTARVYFPDMGNMVSDWLYLMRYPNLRIGVSLGSSGNHDHAGAMTSDGSHSHGATVTVGEWYPDIDDKVLVVYAPGFNADGFILGAIQ